MSFGNASLKLLVSLFLLSGCSNTSGNSLYPAFKQYETKIKQCMSSAKNGARSFPESGWLSSLGEEQQKQVLLYLSESAMKKCSQQEKIEFSQTLAKENQDVQRIMSEWLDLDKPNKEMPMNIDNQKLKVLEIQISSPFYAFEIFEKLRNNH